MRHVLAAVAAALRAGGMAEPAGAGLLVAPARLTLLAATGGPPAGARAVPVAAIAGAADEEDLAALEPMAGDEAQRVHGSGAVTAKNWTLPASRATKDSSKPGSG